MKVLDLSIRNFMAVGEIKSLPLNDKGLVLIQGENKDDTSQESNGAGKSTIAEALCWCLYGQTARQETGDAIINDVAKKGTEVVVKLLDETGGVYRVSRYRKHKPYKNMVRVELQEGEGWKDLTKGTDKLTQELIDKIIGCTHEVFASSIYAGQEAMPDLPGMTDKQLKILVEEAAGINELQEAHEIARLKLAEVKAEVAAHTGAISTTLSNITVLQGKLASNKVNISDFDAATASKITGLETTLDQARKGYDPSLISRIEAKIAELTLTAAETRDQIAASDAERIKLTELQKTERQAHTDLTRAESAASNALTQARAAKHSLDHVGEKVGSQCDSCGHVIEEADLADSKLAAKRAAVELANKAKQLRDDESAARERAESASETLADFTASMTDVSALSSALSDLESKRTALSSALEGQKQRARDIATIEAQIAAMSARENPYNGVEAELLRDIERLEQQRDTQMAARVEVMDKQTLHEEAVRVFGPAGVRAHILDNVTPFLNNRTAHYLSALTDGNISAVWSTVSMTAKGELREKFVIEVVSKTGAKAFKSLSGGEKRKTRLACAMALQDLVSSRATKPIKLFVADEIDHALDPAGLERLMTVLEEKANDKGTVLVISHSDLTDWIKTSITVVKTGGQSTLVGACL